MKRTLENIHADPIFKALNPEGKHFIEARWLPPKLNPYAMSGIGIAALISFGVFPHIKTVATVRMMLEDFRDGLYDGKHTIVVPSSGNTAHAVARLARAFGFANVKVVMSSDAPGSKTGILRALASADVIQVSNVTATAQEEARKPGHYLLDQYKHMGNVNAHQLYTGPEVLNALGNNIAAVAIAMGSGGTAAGVGRFLKERIPKIVIIGARPLLGEQVPGARDRKKMEEVVTLPWKEVIDKRIEVSRKESFIGTRKLWSAIDPQPGPTSGLAYRAAISYLKSLDKKELEQLRGKCVGFICPDDGRFYSDQILSELDTDQGL